VVVNRVLPELFGQRRGGGLRAAAPARRRGGALGAGRRRGGPPVLEAARLAVTMRRTRAGHLQRLQAGLDPECRAATCPTSSPAPTACARPARWPSRWARSWGTDGAPRPSRAAPIGRLLSAKEIVIACGPGGVGKTTTAAAAAAMAAAEHGGKVLVLTVDPARRLADALGLEGDRQRRGPGPDEAFKPRPGHAPGRAVGGHARHQAESGTTSSAATPPTRRPGSEILANPLYQNISGASSRATTTSPWSGSTRSTPRASTT
jgi:hypothetical protein